MSEMHHYRVRFAVRDYYVIDVVSKTANDAKQIAKDLYYRHGEDPTHGILFDLSDGGTEDWQVTLLNNRSNERNDQ